MRESHRLTMDDSPVIADNPVYRKVIMCPDSQPNNPLHGITLEMMLTQLVEKYGWRFLSDRVAIRCFYNEPTIKSSLHFLRRTPWARQKVEALYLELIVDKK